MQTSLLPLPLLKNTFYKAKALAGSLGLSRQSPAVRSAALGPSLQPISFLARSQWFPRLLSSQSPKQTCRETCGFCFFFFWSWKPGSGPSREKKTGSDIFFFLALNASSLWAFENLGVSTWLDPGAESGPGESAAVQDLLGDQAVAVAWAGRAHASPGP